MFGSLATMTYYQKTTCHWQVVFLIESFVFFLFIQSLKSCWQVFDDVTGNQAFLPQVFDG